MTEATGYEAKTIHRLLEVNADMSQDGAYFERGEDNPLEVDVIIVDETSMVDIFLMQALLKAVSIGTRVVFVGDMNQLPSVGPGNVLLDIIRSGVVPVTVLDVIYRQNSTSPIITNANKMMRGDTDLVYDKTFYLFETENDTETFNTTNKIIIRKNHQHQKRSLSRH